MKLNTFMIRRVRISDMQRCLTLGYTGMVPMDLDLHFLRLKKIYGSKLSKEI
jgi:hypothetical protein